MALTLSYAPFGRDTALELWWSHNGGVQRRVHWRWRSCLLFWLHWRWRVVCGGTLAGAVVLTRGGGTLASRYGGGGILASGSTMAAAC
eukprot:2793587-Rhodomonas_salina.1